MFKMGCSMAKKILAIDKGAASSSSAGASAPPTAPGTSQPGPARPTSGDELGDFSKLEQDPRLPLNVRQVFKITKSWKAIARTMSKTGTAMFLNLFEQNRDLFYLFDRFQHLKGQELHDSMELREHASTVMSTLDQSINSLSDYDNFVTYLHSIGKLHRKVPGFKREYFWKIEQPFLKAVKQTLDERCNETIEEIYKIAIKLIIETIADGYGQDPPASARSADADASGGAAGSAGPRADRLNGEKPQKRSSKDNGAVKSTGGAKGAAGSGPATGGEHRHCHGVGAEGGPPKLGAELATRVPLEGQLEGGNAAGAKFDEGKQELTGESVMEMSGRPHEEEARSRVDLLEGNGGQGAGRRMDSTLLALQELLAALIVRRATCENGADSRARSPLSGGGGATVDGPAQSSGKGLSGDCGRERCALISRIRSPSANEQSGDRGVAADPNVPREECGSKLVQTDADERRDKRHFMPEVSAAHLTSRDWRSHNGVGSETSRAAAPIDGLSRRQRRRLAGADQRQPFECNKLIHPDRGRVCQDRREGNAAAGGHEEAAAAQEAAAGGGGAEVVGASTGCRQDNEFAYAPLERPPTGANCSAGKNGGHGDNNIDRQPPRDSLAETGGSRSKYRDVDVRPLGELDELAKCSGGSGEAGHTTGTAEETACPELQPKKGAQWPEDFSRTSDTAIHLTTGGHSGRHSRLEASNGNMGFPGGGPGNCCRPKSRESFLEREAQAIPEKVNYKQLKQSAASSQSPVAGLLSLDTGRGLADQNSGPIRAPLPATATVTSCPRAATCISADATVARRQKGSRSRDESRPRTGYLRLLTTDPVYYFRRDQSSIRL